MGILFRQIDKDGSGHIDFKEFAAALNADEHSDKPGNFFVGGGRGGKRCVRQEMKTSIGLKRTWEILRTKIEQRCKSSSNGPFGMTAPHVLARMFHEFDIDGGGALSRDEFERALKEKLGLMMISKKDLDALTDEFDQDGDGEISYDEFISKVMPPEITHGGGGIMDFPCDDPAGKGTVKEQLERLRKQIKKKLATKSSSMRKSFRKMAVDGKINKYRFMACMRNLDVGVGQPKLVERLFHEIDDDNSGFLTFAEFSAGIEHPADDTTDIKIERNIPKEYLEKKTVGSALMGENPQETSRPNTPEEDISSDVARPETDQQSSEKPVVRQQLRSRESKQRFQGWQRRFQSHGQIPKV